MLIVSMFIILTGTDTGFRFLNHTCTRDGMNQVILVSNWPSTLFTLLRSSLTLPQMRRIISCRHIQITILTILRPSFTLPLMLHYFIRLEWLTTIFACWHLVKLLLMLFGKVDIIHLSACLTFFNITTTVSEMSSALWFGKWLMTIVTDLMGLLVHILFSSNYFQIYNRTLNHKQSQY